MLQLTKASLFPVCSNAVEQATIVQLEASGCALDTLVACGQQQEALFLQQVVALMTVTAGAPLQQAYGANEAGAVSWKPARTLGVSRDFLVPHLIVFSIC